MFDDRLAHIKNLDVRKKMRLEIRHIQVSNSPDIFNRSVKLWCLERSGKDPQVDEFLAYFKSFITDKSGWFEGFSIGDPSQTNGLEGSSSRA